MDLELDKLFIRRLKEEMESRGMSDNQLAGLATELGYKIRQTTISAIKRGKQSPSLRKVEAIAKGLDIPVWTLCIDSSKIEQKIIRPVAAPQQELPKIFTGLRKSAQKKQTPTRRKRVA